MRRMGFMGGLFAFVALFALQVQPARASANAQNTYANALLADGQTYAFTNAYQSGGQVGGMVWLGDLLGVNLLVGVPTALSYPVLGQSHVDGAGVYNGLGVTFSEDISAFALAWRVDLAGVPIWAGSSLFAWAGVILSP